jgi:hypothetical protein
MIINNNFDTKNDEILLLDSSVREIILEVLSDLTLIESNKLVQSMTPTQVFNIMLKDTWDQQEFCFLLEEKLGIFIIDENSIVSFPIFFPVPLFNICGAINIGTWIDSIIYEWLPNTNCKIIIKKCLSNTNYKIIIKKSDDDSGLPK